MAWTDERIDDAVARVEQRFDAVDRRFDHLDGRFDRLEARVDQLIHQQLVFGWGIAAAFMAQFLAFVLVHH